ncbi:MAG: DinB family protein [Acidobacteriota bacterium]
MSIAHQNIHFLEQGLALLGALDDRRFTAVVQRGQGAAGAHLRHVIDYYRCFLRGLDDGRLDYDARSRDRDVETERTAAAAAIGSVVERLGALDPAVFGRELEVKVDAAAWNDHELRTRSTVGRELQFLLSHTVHHYALIAMILRLQDFDPGAEFGVAPSTLEHRESLEGSDASQRPELVTGASAS